MNSRDLIIIGVTAILLILIGMFAVFNSGDTQTTMLTMTSSSILNEGDSLVLKLSDENKTAIANGKIQINLTNPNGVTENFTLKTNSKGECRLEDLISGNFSFIAKYNGDKKHSPSSLSGTIRVNKISNGPTVSNDNGNDQYKSDYKVDDVINGWDPSEHEVSREDLGDGMTRITYDDGYFRIVDDDGNILNYGYWYFFYQSLNYF